MSQFLPLLQSAASRIRSPVAIVLGAPRLVVDLVQNLGQSQVTCYQMDLFQGERLRAELVGAGLVAEVRVASDLWDLPQHFETVLYPAPPRGERELKIDMVEQAFHVLRPKGTFVALSPIRNDQFFPKLIKKVFGRSAVSADEGTVVWGQREGDRPKRRHEITVQARIDDGLTIRFLTRPGVFTYGRLDLGTRALLSAVEIAVGDRVLDAGCGTGAAGIVAGLRAGAGGHVTFVDSNLRALALTELNARQAGLSDFKIQPAIRLDGLDAGSFDVVLTNPPYFAQQAIASMFIERSFDVLKPGGRFYLVTKQFEEIEPLVRSIFGEPELFECRGYIILVARKQESSTKTPNSPK